MRRKRLVVLGILGITVPTVFAALALAQSSGLPSWFTDLDKDEDGQVSRYEWRAAGKKAEEFRKFDRNDDGFITEEEVLRLVGGNSPELKWNKGKADYRGSIEATDEKYRGNKLAKILPVRLEAGKVYQFDHRSQAFDAYLYLEDPDGTVVAEDDDGAGQGTDARIIYRAADTGTYRLIATSVGGVRGGPFVLSVRVIGGGGGGLPTNLPAWFKELDKDKDGQISLYEWRKGGKTGEEFRKYDLNEDGFVTPEEVLRVLKNGTHLELVNGLVDYNGVVEEAAEDRYQGKKSFHILTIKLQQGVTYQIEQVSQEYYAYLYLENPDGDIVEKHNSGGRGLTARVVHRAARSGTYRIIATSQDGHRTGPFALTVRVLSDGAGGAPPSGLPAWFHELDTDRDGQIALYEWLKGGKDAEEFRKYDANGDGFITAQEVLRVLRGGTNLKLDNGKATHHGVIEEPVEEDYQGKMAFRVLTVKLQKGVTYQIEHGSPEFFTYMYLEGPDGEIVEKNGGGKNRPARVIHRAAKSGLYRIIATSQDGRKTGAFTVTVQSLTKSGAK
jgi:Ca2+-binding EF-hand superfamily protein